MGERVSYRKAGEVASRDAPGLRDPYCGGSFVYGRPRKGHGWHPMTNAALVRMMAEHITANAPAGEKTSAWKYR